MIADRRDYKEGRWRPSTLYIVWIGLLSPALTAGISTSVGPQVALFVLLAGWLSIFDGGATWRGLVLGSSVAALLLCHTVVTESMGTCRDLMLKSAASQVLLILVLASLSVLASAGCNLPSQRGVARLVAVLVAAVVVEKI